MTVRAVEGIGKIIVYPGILLEGTFSNVIFQISDTVPTADGVNGPTFNQIREMIKSIWGDLGYPTMYVTKKLIKYYRIHLMA